MQKHLQHLHLSHSCKVMTPSDVAIWLGKPLPSSGPTERQTVLSALTQWQAVAASMVGSATGRCQ